MTTHAALQQDLKQFAEQLEELARRCSSVDQVYDAWKAGWRTIVGGSYDVDREWLDRELNRVQDHIFKDGILSTRIAARELAESAPSQAVPSRVRVLYRECEIVAWPKRSPVDDSWTVSTKLQDAHWPHRPWQEDRIDLLPDATGFDSRQAATEYSIAQGKVAIDRALTILDDA